MFFAIQAEHKDLARKINTHFLNLSWHENSVCPRETLFTSFSKYIPLKSEKLKVFDLCPIFSGSYAQLQQSFFTYFLLRWSNESHSLHSFTFYDGISEILLYMRVTYSGSHLCRGSANWHHNYVCQERAHFQTTHKLIYSQQSNTVRGVHPAEQDTQKIPLHNERKILEGRSSFAQDIWWKNCAIVLIKSIFSTGGSGCSEGKFRNLS